MKQTASQLKPASGGLYAWLRPKRGARRLIITLGGALVLAGGFALAGSKPSPVGLTVQDIPVTATPIVAFDKANPAKTRFGKLTWRGGLVLTSPSRHFGGWSGLALGGKGKRLVAVSDVGTWMTADLDYDEERPRGLASVKLGALQSLAGDTLARARDRDAEGIALAHGTLAKGQLLISFERNQRIGRLDIGAKGISAPKSYVALPKAMKQVRGNGGIEAIAVLRAGPYSGSLVAIPERLHDGSGSPKGWLWVKGRPQEFKVAGGDFSVTDAAALPDGGLLILERRFRWDEGVKVRLRLVRRHELRPGARIKGEILLNANMNQEIDNLEGLAVHEGQRGEIVVTMISDDNFNPVLQRTVLLQFSFDRVELASADKRP